MIRIPKVTMTMRELDRLKWGSLIFASKSDGRSTGYFPMVFDPSSISE